MARKKQTEETEEGMHFNVSRGKNKETIKVSDDNGEVTMTVSGNVDIDDAFQYMPQAFKRTSKINKKKRG